MKQCKVKSTVSVPAGSKYLDVQNANGRHPYLLGDDRCGRSSYADYDKNS